MNPKTSFTHFFKIQKTPEVQHRKDGLTINTNAGIIYDSFEESFYNLRQIYLQLKLIVLHLDLEVL